MTDKKQVFADLRVRDSESNELIRPAFDLNVDRDGQDLLGRIAELIKSGKTVLIQPTDLESKELEEKI